MFQNVILKMPRKLSWKTDLTLQVLAMLLVVGSGYSRVCHLLSCIVATV